MLRAADLAEQRGQGGFAMLAAHDAARLGAVEPAARQLARLALSVDGEIVTVMSTHATALVNRDAEVLERSSRAFEDLGWLLLAAEAAAVEAMAVCDGEGRRDRARTNAAHAVSPRVGAKARARPRSAPWMARQDSARGEA